MDAGLLNSCMAATEARVLYRNANGNSTAPNEAALTTAAKPSRRKKIVWSLFGLAVSVLCLWISMRGMLNPKSLQEIGAAFRRADYRILFPYWGGLFVFYWLKSWRWRMLLRPLGSYRPLRDMFPPIMIGFAFNNILPAHLGEFYRVFVFSRRNRLNYTAVLSTVVLERVFDILAIVAFLACGLFFVKDLGPAFRQSAIVFGIAAAVIVAGALIFVTWTKPFVRLFERMLGLFPFIPAGLRAKVCGMLETAADGLTSLHNPALVVGIVLTSLAQWAINGWLIHLSLISFGIHVSLWVSCIVLGVVAFGVTIPSSPGYFGVIQLCFMSVLKVVGVKDEPAILAASVFFQLAQYFPVTFTGLFFAARSGLSLWNVEPQASQNVAPESAVAPSSS